MSIFEHDINVTFGDCDPAGIVFYPNFFRWLDATFHAWLRAGFGGHGALCKELGAVGLGVMKSEIDFRSPATDGGILRLSLTGIDWEPKVFRLQYQAHVGERLVLTGAETRGMFVRTDNRMKAGDMAPLRERLG